MVTDYVFKANDLINKMNLEINYQKGLYNTVYDKNNYDTFINGLIDIKKKLIMIFYYLKIQQKIIPMFLAKLFCI